MPRESRSILQSSHTEYKLISIKTKNPLYWLEVVFYIQIQYKGTQLMDKNTINNSFWQWASPMNMKLIDDYIQKHHVDYYSKKLNALSFIFLLLHAQLKELKSLREISDCMISKDLQDLVGFESISYSQLSRRLSNFPTELLKNIFDDLVTQIQINCQRTNKTVVYKPLKIIDSSTITVNQHYFPWAEYKSAKSGVKLHVSLANGPDSITFPTEFYITNACEHDHNHLESFLKDDKYTYVFDRGYTSYQRFDEMTENGKHFVTRLKSNATYTVVESFSVSNYDNVISDQEIILGSKLTRVKNKLRRITVIDSKGKELVILTNRFDLTSEEVADIYKSRWEVELFFKWIKQHLRVKVFYGHSQTAVNNQIYFAMIVYCLNILAKLKTKTTMKPLQIVRFLKELLWKEAKYWFQKICDSVP